MKALLLAPMGSVHRRFNQVNISALRSLGYEVHLAANFENGEGTESQNAAYVRECLGKGIITYHIPYQRHEIRRNIHLISPTRELIKREHFDIIHAHTETGGLILRLVGKTEGRKIYTPHGMSFYRGAPLKAQLIYRPIEKWICAGMDTNIAINREELSVLKKWNKRSAKYVHGIGLDIERLRAVKRSREELRRELGIPEDAFVVLSVGELDDNKNHIVCIEALKQLDNVYYVICGVGPNRDMLMNAGLGKRLILTGYRRDVPDIIAAADIFAFPSFHEGLPVALMEAMAGGLPCVGSKIRGNVDLIKDGKNGFLVEPHDAARWREDILALCGDEKLRAVYAEKSFKRINQFSEKKVYEEYLSLYRQSGE